METKVDFCNVPIQPRPNQLNSRSEVQLTTTKTFKHAKHNWTGIPIIAANMDTTGTFGVYRELAKHGIITAFHKFYTPEDYQHAHNGAPPEPKLFYGLLWHPRQCH